MCALALLDGPRAGRPFPRPDCLEEPEEVVFSEDLPRGTLTFVYRLARRPDGSPHGYSYVMSRYEPRRTAGLLDGLA